MVKKSIHPELALFEYLSGNLEKKDAQSIEDHLSECAGCASVVSVVRVLKETASRPAVAGESVDTGAFLASHPDLSELASFFYAKPQRSTGSNVGAHVALCGHCGDAIAQYARAEHAAAEYEPANAAPAAVPEQAWEMIRDWEDSSFAQTKPANEVLGQELLARLSHILNEQQSRRLHREASLAQPHKQVPVLIVSSAGEVRGIELFDRELDATGASILRHSEGSARFDNKPLLLLFGFGEAESFVVSNPVQRDTIRVKRLRTDEDSQNADYIIIED